MDFDFSPVFILAFMFIGLMLALIIATALWIFIPFGPWFIMLEAVGAISGLIAYHVMK